ncbi:MAG: aminotransferase class V-fold PLP-dependent enzyme, partial [Patescibacteria group bacterium]
INGGSASRAPHISNILFRGVEAETLLIALDDAGIMASSGSACQAKAIEPSHVLLAMGLSRKETMSSVRFSFGKFITKQDIDKVLEVLPEMVEKLRK